MSNIIKIHHLKGDYLKGSQEEIDYKFKQWMSKQDDDVSTNPEKFTTQGGMREIIQRERMIELAFEGQGSLDRRRWKMMDKLLTKGAIKGFTYNALTTDEYCKPYPVWPTDFKFRDYFWPIKISNLQINPNLVQNPGWEF